MNRTYAAAVAVLLAAVALAGCREEEQGRAIIPDKGTYAGPAETPLTKAQIDQLSDRAALQGESTTGGPAAGPATAETPTPTTAPPPQEGSNPALDRALSERMRMQGN